MQELKHHHKERVRRERKETVWLWGIVALALIGPGLVDKFVTFLTW